jgi:hypothetical protein
MSFLRDAYDFAMQCGRKAELGVLSQRKFKFEGGKSMAEGKAGEILISFRSGHYKKIKGALWTGDSVWSHFEKAGGGMIHVNKEEVEYMETFGDVERAEKESTSCEERRVYKDPRMRPSGLNQKEEG